MLKTKSVYMNKKLIPIYALFISLALSIIPAPQYALAQTQNSAATEAINFLDQTASKAGLTTIASGEQKTLELIGNIINILLGFVGIIFFIQIFWAGIKWMTAAGNEEIIKESKNTIKNATIGIVVVFSAFVITNFTLSQIENITNGQTTNENQTQKQKVYCKYTDEVGTEHCFEAESRDSCVQTHTGEVVENCSH